MSTPATSKWHPLPLTPDPKFVLVMASLHLTQQCGLYWANPNLKPSTLPNPKRVQVVAPSTPREKDGMYWGYTTRLARSISGLLEGCPFKKGYDLKLGTSEHGQKVRPRRHKATNARIHLPMFRLAIPISFEGLKNICFHLCLRGFIESYLLLKIRFSCACCSFMLTSVKVPLTIIAIYIR